MRKKRLALLGCGYLNKIVGNAVKNGILKDYEIVGILGRNFETTREVADYFNCSACSSIKELMDLKPDFVSEAASAKALISYAETILKSGSNIVILSAAALADVEFFERIKQTAIDNNTKIYLAGGATGAYSLLQTALMMSKTPIDVTINSKKSPQFIARTPFYKEGLDTIKTPERVFTGTAKKIIEEYPYVFNVILATSLASAGADATKFNIDATPNFVGDDYNIKVEGDDVQLDLNILSQDYSIAGWSIVTILKNATSPVVF